MGALRHRSLLPVLAVLALALLPLGGDRPAPRRAYAADELGCPVRDVPRYGLNAIRAPEAHRITIGSPNVIVAVVDSGVDYTHPDLVGHIWQNGAEIPANGLDDDGNGFVDDLIGYNFVPPRNNDPADTLGHGTFISSIIASVAPGVKIMAVRAGDNRGPRLSDSVAAIRYAVDNGASVINISFASAASNLATQDVLDYALAHDVVIALAAGNGGSMSSSAAFYNQAMRVTATTSDDRLASFANYGPWVDVAAPGAQIYGATLNGGHAVCDGTSFSAPFAAGVAALVRSAEPRLSAREVIERIRTTADDINRANPRFAGTLTFGRLNAVRALGGTAEAVPPAAAAPALPSGGAQPGISNAPGALGGAAVSGATGALAGIGAR